jgi:hypothetical protein
MQRNQEDSPLPSDPPAREDIMSSEPAEQERNPASRESSPLPPESAGREDIISAEAPDEPAGG